MSTNNQDLVEFNNICDEFIAGKYILADIKIGSLLKSIAEHEKIKNIIASCTEKFDFNTEYKNSVSEDEKGNLTLTLPEEETEQVAFIFSLLYKMDNKDISFYDFLSKFYHEDGEEAGKEFINFSNTIIVPFKEAINNMYSSRHFVVSSNEYKANYFNKIMSTIRLIVNNMEVFRLKVNEKEEFTLLLNALYIASENNDKKQVFALMIGLDYFTKVNKRARNAYLSLEECFANN